MSAQRLFGILFCAAAWVTGGLTHAGDKSADGSRVLFDGRGLGGWKFRGGEKTAAKSKWSVVGGLALEDKMPSRFTPKPGAGVMLNGDDGRGVDLLSEVEHGDCELDVEFNVAKGSNSGIYFQGQYEVQILDSFGKKDADLKYGDCGGIYNHAPPRKNVSKAPGEWQTFHVVFRAPRFDAKGKKTENAKFVKVVHNGVVIHENVEVKGPTTSALGGPERPLGRIMLQGDHGPVAFRKITLKASPAKPDEKDEELVLKVREAVAKKIPIEKVCRSKGNGQHVTGVR